MKRERERERDRLPNYSTNGIFVSFPFLNNSSINDIRTVMTSPDPLFSRKTECGYSAIDLAGSVDPDSCFFSRPSIVKRESFISQFRTTNGAPQVVAVVFMLAMAMGSIIGIIPSIMTERYAVLRYNYDGDDCNNYTSYDEKPQECIDASADAQNAAAISELVANILTLVSSSWLGSITDVHGRRGTNHL